MENKVNFKLKLKRTTIEKHKKKKKHIKETRQKQLDEYRGE